MNIIIYILISVGLILSYPYFEKYVGVYNLLYTNNYAIMISILYYIIFLTVIISSFFKKYSHRWR